MSQLVFSIHWNPEEVGSNASERMDLPARVRAKRQRANFLKPCPLYRLPTEGMAQNESISSYFKVSGLKVGFPHFRQLKKNSS